MKLRQKRDKKIKKILIYKVVKDIFKYIYVAFYNKFFKQYFIDKEYLDY